MTPWRLRTDTPHHTYGRPLGLTELGFYWDSVFSGTADTIQHAIVEDQTGDHLFSVENVARTWLALKQQFPLLGSQLAEQGEVVFVVTKQRLEICGPEEISFRHASSLEEVQRFMDNAINGERLLSNTLLARVFIFLRTDKSTHVHVLIHIAHCITDGIANATLLRCFLETISSPPSDVQWDLEKRLALAVASEDLAPSLKLNPAKRRWQRAISQTLASVQMAKIAGGHTLPRKITRLTPYTPAHSDVAFCSFSAEKSAQIIHNCRKRSITFGNALFVLGQVALTRVLCRRYIRGEIDEAEWNYRRREPMITRGPLSLRPFLDRQWFEQGGASNVSVSISFFVHILPFMPLGSAFDLAPGCDVPDFQHLLSSERFFLRCNLIKKQSIRLIRQPLFLDVLSAHFPKRVERRKAAAMHQSQKDSKQVDASSIPVTEQGAEGPVTSYGMSSSGIIDNLIPHDFPSSGKDTSAKPLLHLQASGTKLRCRPAELYLGSSTAHQQLRLHVFFDKNVFDKETVEEWLQGVSDATELYLGPIVGPQARL